MLGLLAVFAFIVLNGFFVAAEFALVKLRATYQGGKPKPDDMVGQAVSKIDRYLSVTQLGITLASLGLGWVGEATIERLFVDAFLRATGRIPGPTAHTLVAAAAFSVITFGHVLLGELVPKLIAIQRSMEVARFSVWPLRVSFYMLWPALWLLETSSRAILSRLGMKLDAHGEAELTEEEILGIIAASVARGHGAADKQELVKRMMRFAQRVARQAMVPRGDVQHLPIHASGQQALDFLRIHQYSRLPLSKSDELDQVVGYLYWKDLLQDRHDKLTSLDSLRRDILFVPETQGLVNALRSMQKAQTPIAMVVDEYGGVSGLLTMEDLLEEIVGEIRDETDEEAQRMEKKGDAWEVDAGVELDELVAVGLEPGEHEGHATVGARMLASLGRIPRVGDHLIIGLVRAEAIAIVRRRIVRVRLTVVEPPEPPG